MDRCRLGRFQFSVIPSSTNRPQESPLLLPTTRSPTACRQLEVQNRIRSSFAELHDLSNSPNPKNAKKARIAPRP